MFKKLQSFCQELEHEFSKITPARREQLSKLAAYFSKKYQSVSPEARPKVTVICTHNSRRSHLAQIWLAAAADFYHLPKIETFSGGTEATAFFPAAVAAMVRAGFKIENSTPEIANPVFQIRWKRGQKNYPAFSKKYDDAPNPTKNFAAVLVCSSADEACPVVFGADFRLSLPFDDPKKSDGTAFQKEIYDARCREIGREMLWVMRMATG